MMASIILLKIVYTEHCTNYTSILVSKIAYLPKSNFLSARIELRTLLNNQNNVTNVIKQAKE